MDLNDPSPGALLLLGDDPNANRRHLKAIAHSIAAINEPRHAQIVLLSSRPDIFDLAGKPHLAEQASPYEAAAYIALSEGYLEAERRMETGVRQPAIILVIDPLEVILREIDPAGLAFFRWLLRKGPEVNVWTIAALTTLNTKAFDWRTVRSFGTCVVGAVKAPKEIAGLTGIGADVMQALHPGQQAALKLGDRPVVFEIPRE